MYVTALNFVFSNIKRAYHSHFSNVNRRQSPHFRRIRKKTLQMSVFLIKMADEEGFEPPIRVTPYKRFRVARIQPLCHSSVTINLIMIICSFGKYYLNTFTLFSIGSNVFSSAGSSLLPTGIWLISFHVGGKFHSLITASSINGL